MNHSDIKLVIDQLEQMTGGDNDMETLGSAIHALETLGNQVAAQTLEITKLREYFQVIKEYNLHYGLPLAVINLYKEALSIPTDSTQILQEWLDAKLGSPFAWVMPDEINGSDLSDEAFGWFKDVEGGHTIPLFKKPEILK